MFSIIIPTWNNLAYLKICVDSIRKNSDYKHQIIVHVNDGKDGTLKWVKEQGLHYSYTPDNAGICVGVNMATALVEQNYIVYMNDDMYVCPNWDKELYHNIEEFGTDCFMLSATMIEPKGSGNPCVIVKDYSDAEGEFEERKLLEEHSKLEKEDWTGSAWPPTVVHRKYWHIIGGYSIEFSPGMSSDDDFAMKMWQAGCRIFKGAGKSHVYHFQAKSTGRVVKNDGRAQFLMKWGINQSTFNKHYIRRGAPWTGTLSEPDESILKKERARAWLKRKLS